MTDTALNPSAGWRMKVAIFALCVSIFAALWFATAALGTKFGLWPWQVGLGQMTIGLGAKIAVLAVLIALVAQVISLIKAPRKQPFMVALAATLIASMLMFRLIGMGNQAAALPPIHDIQTDWTDPIRFSTTLMAKRTADGETNPVIDAPIIPEAANDRWPGMGGTLVSAAQAEAEIKEAGKGTVYPALDPLYFSTAPGEVSALAEQLINKKGWNLVTPAPTDTNTGVAFQIEATATSGWFGFKDDIAIRIRPVEGAVRVDMRSVSRVGLSDLGANSKRVAGFMNELRDRGDGRSTP